MKFPVAIHKDENSIYGVTIPDLPGCFSAGNTIEEALSQAVEAIECHIEGLLTDNDPIPEPQSITVHKANPEFSDAVCALVPVDFQN